MKPETIDRIMQAVEEEIRRSGAENWDGAMESAKQTLNIPTGVVPFAKGFPCDRLLSKAELQQLCLEQPEPTPSELRHLIKQIRDLTGKVRTVFIQAAKKEIPPDRGGRPSKLGTPQEQKKIVKEVLSLIEEGAQTTDALARVARRHDLSLSSMQRIWKMRRKPDSGRDKIR